MAARFFTRPKGPLAAPTPFLYVANCGAEADMTYEALAAIFGKYGSVEEVIPAGEANLTRCFVAFHEASAAAAARAALHGQPCQEAGGRIMFIDFAVLKKAPDQPYSVKVGSSAAEVGIEGLHFIPSFISEEEERALLEEVDAREWHYLTKRRVQHYGYAFNYKTRDIERETFIGPLPSFVSSIVQRAEREEVLRAADEKETCLPFDQMTVNEYTKGVGLSPHIDTHIAFEGAVLSLSLAGSVVMEFRRAAYPPPRTTATAAAFSPLERPRAVAEAADSSAGNGAGSETLEAPIERRQRDGCEAAEAATLQHEEVMGGQLGPLPLREGRGDGEGQGEMEGRGEVEERGEEVERGVEKLEGQMIERGPGGGAWLEDGRAILLPPRSLLILTGEARYMWSHYIPHHKMDWINGTRRQREQRRVSFTFRRVRFGCCRCPFPLLCDAPREGEQAGREGSKAGERGEGLQGGEKERVAVEREDEDKEPKFASGEGHRSVERDAFGAGSSEAEQVPRAEGREQDGRGERGNGLDQGRTSSSASSSSLPSLEATFVLSVYDAIAPHFSSTRFAKWPKVAEFLKSLPRGALVLDAGCGNGKYLNFNPGLIFIGCDFCAPLVDICRQHGHEVAVADTIHLPYLSAAFDAVISIAVLHHLSTERRRQLALLELLRVVKAGGRVFVSVWAREQEDESLVAKWTPLSGQFTERWVGAGGMAADAGQKGKDSVDCMARVEEEEDGIEQVNAAVGNQGNHAEGSEPGDSVVCGSELRASRMRDLHHQVDSSAPVEEGGTVSKLATGKAWTAPEEQLSQQAEQEPAQDFFVPWHLPFHRAEIRGAALAADSSPFIRRDEKKGAVVFNRFYHVFKKKELESLAEQVGAKVVDAFYDKSNWCVILEKCRGDIQIEV